MDRDGVKAATDMMNRVEVTVSRAASGPHKLVAGGGVKLRLDRVIGRGDPGELIRVDEEHAAGRVWRQAKATVDLAGEKEAGGTVVAIGVKRLGAGAGVLKQRIRTNVGAERVKVVGSFVTYDIPS